MSDATDKENSLEPSGDPGGDSLALELSEALGSSTPEGKRPSSIPSSPRKSLPPQGGLLIPMPRNSSRSMPPPGASPADSSEPLPALAPPPLPDLPRPAQTLSEAERTPPLGTAFGAPGETAVPPTSSVPPFAAALRRRSSSPPPSVPDPSFPPSAPTTDRLVEAAGSIRPMRVINLGGDGPRSSPVTGSRSRPPPAVLPSPPALPSFEEPRTEPRSDLPPLAAAEAEDEITVDVDEAPPVQPPPKPARPAPPSARLQTGLEAALEADASKPEDRDEDGGAPTPAVASAATSDLEPPTAHAAEELSDVEVGPASDEEAVHVEETEPVVALPQELPPPRPPSPSMHDDGTTPKKPPPPPPKRAKTTSGPTDGAETGRSEPAPQPRPKRWWEELFTEDFARGIFPLSGAQVRREVDFIEESLGVAKGGIVLDLACGTGHHAVELSSRGYGVVGFDLSLPQLALAGEYAQERQQKINFLQGDMRDMSFDSVFDGVYCWDTSFGYFEEDKNVAVAERVFRSLRPGGNFLLDVINRDFVVEQQPSQVWFEGDACVCMDDMSVDFITSRLRVKRTMMLDDGRTRELSYSVRVYSLHELGKILHSIGFRVIEASGHLAYPGTFLGATSPRVMILAQKP